MSNKKGRDDQCAVSHVWYCDDDDLADKYERMAKALRGRKKLLVNKPRWLEMFVVNWGGGGGFP